MFKVAIDKDCAIENNNIWPAHKTQNIYGVVQACFLCFFVKNLRCEKFVLVRYFNTCQCFGTIKMSLLNTFMFCYSFLFLHSV